MKPAKKHRKAPARKKAKNRKAKVNSKAVHFILTGGTIDSRYDGTKDTVVPRKESVIPSYISGLKLYAKTRFTTVCMKDSRQMTKSDLRKILKAVEKSPCRKVIITHGTYTIDSTARYLKANLKRKNQTIVLTASMIPIEGFTFSDAGFNLGFAFSEIMRLEPGVYACVNGRVFLPEEITKIISKGRFVSVFNK